MNYKKLFIGALVVIVIVLVAGFLSLRSRVSPVGVGRSLQIEQGIGALKSGEAFAPSTSLAVPQDTSSLTEKKIIRTGSLSLVVQSAEQAVKDITDITQKQNGFVQSSYVSEDKEGSKRGSITVRIPSSIFFETIQAIKALAQIVEVEQTNAQDVTEQFIDLEARLKNLRATEVQYLELLKRSGSVKDILEVTRELSQVRGQIESLQGQIQYLERQSDMATITVSLSEVPTVRLSLKNFQPINAIKAAFRTLASALISLINLFINFVIVGIPIILIVIVLLAGAWRIIRFGKAKFFS